MDEPPVVVFMQEGEEPVVDRLDSAGTWRAETAWPAPGASERVLHLAADGALADEPGSDGADELRYDPTVGVTAGLWSGGIHFGLPGRPAARRGALAHLHVAAAGGGRARARTAARRAARDLDSARVIGFCVSLADVRPDGTSHLVAKGMLNVTRRDSLREPTPLEPGERAALAVDLDTTGWVFRRGHRLRVSVANADWPNVWPTPEPATSEVLRGAASPSHVVLPLVPATAARRRRASGRRPSSSSVTRTRRSRPPGGSRATCSAAAPRSRSPSRATCA